MINEYSIITTTFPKKAQAKRVGKLLVEKQLAACVQVFPIESIYRWEGEIFEEAEAMLIIKSKTVLFNDIAKLIKENHSYDVPEIVQIPITDGTPEYLKWIGDCTLTKDGAF